jgi:hypothetical protein
VAPEQGGGVNQGKGAGASSELLARRQANFGTLFLTDGIEQRIRGLEGWKYVFAHHLEKIPS